MDLSRKTRNALIVVGLFGYALVFQGSRGLWEPDEGRYTAVALEMLGSGDWLHPRLLGEEHLSKPPLTYWAIAASVRLLGRNEWAARLPDALAFVATTLMVYALARRLCPACPWLPALIYATFGATYVSANAITTDTLLTLWETLAVWGFVAWWWGGGRRWPVVVMWLAFGLAFMTKGPPGLLPLLPVVVFAVWRRGEVRPRSLFHPIGVLLFLAVGLWWFALLAVEEPERLSYWLSHEVARRLAGEHRRNPRWYDAFRVYLPFMLAGTLPWTMALLRGIPCAARVVARAWRRRPLPGDDAKAFALVWFALPLAVFAVVPSRLPLYVLPLFVPLALLGGMRLGERALRGRLARALLFVWVTALVGVKGAGALYGELSLRYAHKGLRAAEDSRVLARRIRVAAGGEPDQIVFVGSTPFYGLRLYLRSPVGRIRVSGKGKVFERSGMLEQPLTDPGTVVVVSRRAAERFKAYCNLNHLRVELIGRVHKLALCRLRHLGPGSQAEPRLDEHQSDQGGDCQAK